MYYQKDGKVRVRDEKGYFFATIRIIPEFDAQVSCIYPG